MTDTVIAEGAVKIRDGRKWKSRWLVLRKPSPVADCLVLYVYKERGVKERSSVTLEHICGVETSVSGEGVFTLSILCLTHTALLGFDSREALQSWDLRLRYCLGEVHSFSVTVLPGTKLESGPATLHLCNNLLVIAKDHPAVILGHWNLLELRRYGPVKHGFVFEGGTRCGYWAGVFFLSCVEGEQISFLFDCIVRGISPSRGPFGLRPVLPEVSAASAQERLNHEAEELEKRLSLLSHSTASSSSVSSSVAGDEHSISGSSDTSDTSQSDSCVSGRPVQWAEPVLPTSAETSHPLAARTASQMEEKLSGGDPVHSRTLKDSGRQNSSDSGIASGSHSSYTGSFSSYAGSLDAAAGPADEYGHVLNLPPPANPEKHLCTCPSSPAHEYQVPSSLRYLYDTPRSLLTLSRSSEDKRTKDESRLSGQTETDVCNEPPSQSESGSALPYTQGTEETLRAAELEGGEGAKTGAGLLKEEESQSSSCSQSGCESENSSPPPSVPKSLFTTCPACGGLKTGGVLLPAVPGKYSCLGNLSEASHLSADDITGQPTNQKPEEIRGSCASFTSHSMKNLSREGSQTSVERESESGVSGCESRRSSPPRRSAHALLYENCLRCRRGEGGCRPPKPSPPSRDICPQPTEQRVTWERDQELFLRGLKTNGPNNPEFLPSASLSLQATHEEDKRQKTRTHSVYEIMERNSESVESSRYELMGGCGVSHRTSLHLSEGGVFSFHVDGLTGLDRPRGDAVTYVNIPTSPTSKKELHYMELDLQETSTTIRGKSSSKYVQIDITATEAAHRAGTQHALGREEGLQRLEQRRRGGAPQ